MNADEIIIYTLNYVVHLENYEEQGGLCFHKASTQIFSPSSLTINPRPTEATTIEGEHMNLNSDCLQRATRLLTCKEAYASWTFL